MQEDTPNLWIRQIHIPTQLSQRRLIRKPDLKTSVSEVWEAMGPSSSTLFSPNPTKSRRSPSSHSEGIEVRLSSKRTPGKETGGTY